MLFEILLWKTCKHRIISGVDSFLSRDSSFDSCRDSWIPRFLLNDSRFCFDSCVLLYIERIPQIPNSDSPWQRRRYRAIWFFRMHPSGNEQNLPFFDNIFPISQSPRLYFRISHDFLYQIPIIETAASVLKSQIPKSCKIANSHAKLSLTKHWL